MTRDKVKSKDYYDDRIAFKKECIEEDIEELKYDHSNPTRVKMKGAFRLVSDSMYLLHQKYSRGDDLPSLKPVLLNLIEYRQWQKDFADALPEGEETERIQWEEIREDYLEDFLKWLSFAYCLNMGKDYYLRMLALIANQGLDSLLDKIAVKMGDIERDISEELLFKKRFSKLYDVIESQPEQRPELLAAYLDAWYELEGCPDYHLMNTDAYIGYWCWEAALVVKLYDIDDSSFINHEYYPKDLVHWQDNSNK
ncbi:PoNi-like cognate immunity protein [Pseudoalteromonas sp. CNC9-20]|uniref:PoNe immunity protein domain-containing protein n=1 Tax=Pseudoalteromonas sp. CNC9-20 TaxID=2917750 RepID=UPI001EF4F876|nr:PoNe immunity protein domain-containing protein [Pseudoalteromonas sp. CNC9-20]MCG7569412.1 PoNi-like cognate immunity protein [Pseudoalteromonas sp. CNC9-20]